MASRLGVSEADLMAVMSFETGGTFDPGIRNAAGSGATGLIQFMPSTAQGLGTTTEALAGMSRTQQLQYVEKYLSNKGVRGGNLSDLYMAVLFPAAVGKSDDFVLFGNGAMSGYTGRAYEQNRGLDRNGDGSSHQSGSMPLRCCSIETLTRGVDLTTYDLNYNERIQFDYSTYDESQEREQAEQAIRDATAQREAMESQEQETATAAPQLANKQKTNQKMVLTSSVT